VSHRLSMCGALKPLAKGVLAPSTVAEQLYLACCEVDSFLRRLQ
jgi:hypothetical protein